MTNEKHEQIKLTPALDAKITTYMQTSDELDSSDFSPIEYSNLIFPTFESLENIDFVISNLKNEVSRIDQSILLQIQQNNSIDKLSSVKQSILGLSTQISRIKENALQSEVMVHEITRDIKSLDTAKRNLSNSVQLLKRLELIVNSIEQLKAYSSKKQYIETAQLLYAAKQVLNNFTTSRNIKQVTNLFDKMTNLETDLKRQVFAEFDAGFLGGVLRVQSSFLKDACLVVDVMELDAQKALVDWYCELQLRDYKANFRNNYEVGGLADVARRFAWLKRLLKLFDEEHSAAFLSHWNVAEYLCEKFCVETKYLFLI